MICEFLLCLSSKHCSCVVINTPENKIPIINLQPSAPFPSLLSLSLFLPQSLSFSFSLPPPPPPSLSHSIPSTLSLSFSFSHFFPLSSPSLSLSLPSPSLPSPLSPLPLSLTSLSPPYFTLQLIEDLLQFKRISFTITGSKYQPHVGIFSKFITSLHL